MRNVYDILKERGLIAQATHEDEIKELLGSKKITFYTGFDPTADSLHIGHFMQLIVMKHMQNAGHRPIVLLGGGTTMVGDPTGKADMRPMISQETIQYNADRFKEQMSRFIDFSDGKALMVNNADWLLKQNYIEFLREVGVHFSVNRMLTAECFKTRLEKGLSFLEFNYMLMQGFDFYKLYKEYGCMMEFGGDDQWSNIIGGIRLIKSKEGAQVYGMTFTLLTTSDGKKMGKTEKGALWLDKEKVSPYDFYQYWRNVDDKDVIRMLKLVTFIPMEEIAEYEKCVGTNKINEVKAKLAYEVTKMVHGEEEAEKAHQAAVSIFSAGTSSDNMPSEELSKDELSDGMNILDLLVKVKLAPSKAEARRLVQQGGISIDGEKITDAGYIVSPSAFADNEAVIKKGKKVFLKVTLV